MRVSHHARWSVSSRAALFKLGAHRLILGGERLPGIQRLRAHFANVVDAHQRGGVGAFGFAQVGFRGCAGIGTPSMRAGKYRTQAKIESGNQLVESVMAISRNS